MGVAAWPVLNYGTITQELHEESEDVLRDEVHFICVSSHTISWYVTPFIGYGACFHHITSPFQKCIRLDIDRKSVVTKLNHGILHEVEISVRKCRSKKQVM